MRLALVNLKTGLVEASGVKGEDLPPTAVQPTIAPDGYLFIEGEAALGITVAELKAELARP